MVKPLKFLSPLQAAAHHGILSLWARVLLKKNPGANRQDFDKVLDKRIDSITIHQV